MKPENLLDAISALFQAKSEAEALQVLKDHPEILDDEANIMLQQLISRAKQHGDARAEKIMGDICEFLHTLRSSSSRESSLKELELSQILQELDRPARLGDIPKRIELCLRALRLVPPENAPLQAALQNELGNSLAQTPSGDRADNIEQAIEHYNQALKVRTQKDFPADWAGTQNNLANAYNNRIRGDRADNIEKAIEHCELALKIYTQKDFPDQWAMTQINLANAHKDRIRGDRADNIEKAFEHYELALKIYTQKDVPEKWAMTQNNLANAYTDRIRGDRADNIEQAIEHYNLALKVYTQKDFPNRCRETAYSLGNTCLESQRFPEAGKAYSLGMEAAEELYKAAIFQSSREAELVETRSLYRRGGCALARSGDAVKAVEALERGRARGLGDVLARDRADQERIRQEYPQAYELYSRAVQALQKMESQERAGASAEGETVLPQRDLMMQARTRLDEAQDRIHSIPGYESFLKEPGWEEIAAAVVEGQPLVYIAAAPGGGVALIVHRSFGSKDASVEAVLLEGFSEERMQEHLKVWFEAYDGWQKALHDMSLDYSQAEEKWFDAIESITGSLWKDVIGPVYGALKPLKPEQVFLIPAGLLSLLPLHAAWRKEGGKRQYLQDSLPVSYVPSARALFHARRTARAASAEKLLAIDESRPVKASPLRNSNAEVSAISSLFKNRQILEHEKATRSAALQALPGAQVVHFSCHGGANWSNPEQSGLLMANNEILTVKDLFELHLEGARLATLSACETGVPGIKLPDEVVSLPAAFIRAGFAGAIGSLWTVSDESTAQLMTSFYHIWRVKGMPPVQALAEAQKRLRDSEKFQHPFYWAAFYLTGV